MQLLTLTSQLWCTGNTNSSSYPDPEHYFRPGTDGVASTSDDFVACHPNPPLSLSAGEAQQPVIRGVARIFVIEIYLNE